MFDSSEKVHIVGVGGSGMSALATILLQRNISVSGSDLRDSVTLDRLRAEGAEIYLGHKAEHVDGATIVAYSSAIAKNNPEILYGVSKGLRVLSRAELLSEVVSDQSAVLVGGTHGKTTTTSMLSLILLNAEFDPSYLVGGELNEVGTSGRSGGGRYFVVEADESDGTFLRITPHLSVLTNVEVDHLEHFGSIERLHSDFRSFVEASETPAVVCVDDEGVRKVTEGLSVLSYGTSNDAHLRIRNLALAPHLTTFELFVGTKRLGQIDLSVPGVHNALNATAAVGAAMQLGVEFESAARSLSRYLGVARRFQLKRVRDGVRYVDDYAHLPTEITATLQSARQVSPKRVVAVFQPHRFSRTKILGRELGEALGAADLVVVTEVYGAGEDPIPGVSAESVFEGARSVLGEKVTYEPRRSELARTVKALLQPGDLCLSLGAGDISLLESEISALEGSI